VQFNGTIVTAGLRLLEQAKLSVSRIKAIKLAAITPPPPLLLSHSFLQPVYSCYSVGVIS